MIRIIDHRGTGKTTKLIQKAVHDKAIIVVPTFRHISYVKYLLERLYPNPNERPYVRIITFHDFLTWQDNEKYYIDELDACLQTVGVLGYSNSIEEESD